MIKGLVYNIKGEWIGLCFKNELLIANTIPLETKSEVYRYIGKDCRLISSGKENKSWFNIASDIFKLYEGLNVEIRANLYFIDPLSRRVLEEVKKIPRGRVSSYKHIGLKTDVSPRLVGRILSKNRYPIIFPCHRVVRSNGALGGFSYGLKYKAKLLEREGVKIVKGHISQWYMMEGT